MSIILTLTSMVIIFPIFSHILFQQQKLQKISECCICRRNIANNEEIIVCPDCHTIYHHRHLSLWLKIRKKCPICKNIIINRCKSSYLDIKANNSSISSGFSQSGVISHQRKLKEHIRIYSRGHTIVLECPHCRNILESSINGILSHCQICGSQMSWICDLDSKIKNLNNIPLYITKNNKRARFIDRKINYRDIERQKEKKREYFQKELYKLAQLESQDQMLLINQDYLRRQPQQLSDKQDNPLRPMEPGEKREYPRKMEFFKIGSIIFFMIVFFIFVTMLLKL